MELVSLAQIALLGVAAWFLWKGLRYLVVRGDIDNLPGPPVPSFLYGHTKELRDRQGWAFHHELMEKYGRVARLKAEFGRTMLYVHDPKAMHQIAVKELDIFEEAEWFTLMLGRTFGTSLFSTHGDHHRKQRKLLNPVFSINHMRHMMPIFYNVTHKLREAIELRVRDGPAEVDVVGWMGRTALELMGQAGLGYSFDPLIKDRSDELGNALKDFVPALSSLGPVVAFFPLVNRLIPRRLQRPLAELMGIKSVMRVIKNADVIHKKSIEIFEQKKRALMQGDEALKYQVGEGKDIMSILLRANMVTSEADRLPEDELVAQIASLTFAAMDTTSNALSLTLWRLAQRQDVQDKLRSEIIEALESQGGQDIGYDDLVSLRYLDAVCRETLRVHAPAPLRFREARQDTVLALSEPVRGIDGRQISQIVVPKDTPVFVNIISSNTDRELWGPDAEEWKPERWLEPLPERLHDAKIPGVYSNLMTFWAGGRACIGFKFSQLEMKVVLAVLLSTFKFELTQKPITWNLAGVTYPSVDAHGERPELPMKVTLLKNDERC
ncbi:cytochrome P450 [Earliella scabrosa]|nr:cytochrome P450 [Earliella scabrosa]